MNKSRIASLCAAAAAVLAGAVYLAVGTPSLAFVLPVMALCFGVIACLRLHEARRSAVEGGFLANVALYLPGAVSAAVAIAAAVGAVAWLAGR